MIVEALAQVGGILAYASLGEEDKDNTLIYFMGIDKARFRKRVVPGDQLILEMDSVKKRSNFFRMSGRATVDGTLAAEADIMAMIGEEL